MTRRVSPLICQVADRSRKPAASIDVTVYPERPMISTSARRGGSQPENQAAMDDALVKAITILGRWKN